MPRALRAAPLLAALLGAACDVPTGLPEWETTWVVPADSARIPASSLLPSGVTVVAGPAFGVSLAPVATSRTLAAMCGSACVAENGATAPKPAFTASIREGIDLPAGLASATLTGGTIGVVLRHGLAFDPLRPGGAARGHLVVTVHAGEHLLARDSLPGETRSFPPDSTLPLELPLAPAPVTGPIDVTVRIVSPAGDPVKMDVAEGLSLTVSPGDLRLSEARVRASHREVAADAVSLDFDGIDAAVVSRVERGALRLEVSNPFAAAGMLSLRITTPTRTIETTVALEPGVRESRVEFTEEELRSILEASPVTATVTGTVTGEGGMVTVRPDQAVVVGTRLELVLVPLEAG